MTKFALVALAALLLFAGGAAAQESPCPEFNSISSAIIPALTAAVVNADLAIEESGTDSPVAEQVKSALRRMIDELDLIASTCGAEPEYTIHPAVKPKIDRLWHRVGLELSPCPRGSRVRMQEQRMDGMMGKSSEIASDDGYVVLFYCLKDS